MRKIPRGLLAFYFVFGHTINAQCANLCDGPCIVSLTFSNGGSISAESPAILSFGNNAVFSIGDGGVIISNEGGSGNGSVNDVLKVGGEIPAGASIALSKGDELKFGANGILNLGDGGNISYTDGSQLFIEGANVVDINASGAVTLGEIHIYGEVTLAGEEINIPNSPDPGGVYLTDRDTKTMLHIGAQNVTVENIVEAGQINIDGLAVLDGQLIAPSLNVVQTDGCDEAMHSDVVLTAGLVPEAVSPSIDCTKSIANTAAGAISFSSGTLSLQPIATETPTGVFRPLVPAVALPSPETAAADAGEDKIVQSSNKTDPPQVNPFSNSQNEIAQSDEAETVTKGGGALFGLIVAMFGGLLFRFSEFALRKMSERDTCSTREGYTF